MEWATAVATDAAVQAGEVGDKTVLTPHYRLEGCLRAAGNAVGATLRLSELAASIRKNHLVEILLAEMSLPMDLRPRLKNMIRRETVCSDL